jgi:transposase
LVAYLKTQYPTVCFQDENIKTWKRIWGRKMYDTALGGFMSILKERIHTPIEVDRFFASTQLCSQCGARHPISLANRTYVCSTRGLLRDRDVNSAINILLEGLTHYGGTERTDINMPVETSTTTVTMVQYFSTIPYVTASRVVEAGSPPL